MFFTLKAPGSSADEGNYLKNGLAVI